MFEDLEVANKEYEDLKAKYDELVIAKNGADEKIKTYEEGNKNYEDEMQRLKIKNYELFEQVTNNNQSNQDKHEEDENEVTFDDIISKIFSSAPFLAITNSSYLAFKSSYSLLATSKSSNILFPPFTCKLNYTTNH